MIVLYICGIKRGEEEKKKKQSARARFVMTVISLYIEQAFLVVLQHGFHILFICLYN